jgi:hypothetical protein
MIWLAYRHHNMYERFLSAAFIGIFGASTGPENDLFKEFKANLERIDKCEVTKL